MENVLYRNVAVYVAVSKDQESYQKKLLINVSFLPKHAFPIVFGLIFKSLKCFNIPRLMIWHNIKQIEKPVKDYCSYR